MKRLALAPFLLIAVGSAIVLLADGGRSSLALPGTTERVSVESTNNPATVTPIAFGDTVSASIDLPAEMDAYTFVGASGDQIIVRMSKTSGSLWPLISVYRPNGTLLCQHYSPSTAEVFCTLTSSGTHTILVGDGFNGTFTGAYSLYLQRTNNPGNATPISFGETLSGSIGAAAEMDTYTFTASAGDVVLVRMSRASGSLYAPDGTNLCSDLNGCSLPTDGTYTILAGGAGDYDLYLQRLNDPGNAIPIAFGDTVSASIDLPAEMDAYTFVGASGDQIIVRMSKTSGSLWPLIRVYRPNGTLLCQHYSPSTAEVSCSLTSSGTHTILVGDGFDGTFTGAYNLYLGCLSVHCGAALNGDTQCDSDVDAVDCLYILQNVVGQRACSDQCPPPAGTLYCPAADTQCDKDIDAVDALFCLQYVVGMRPSLQCSQ